MVCSRCGGLGAFARLINISHATCAAAFARSSRGHPAALSFNDDHGITCICSNLNHVSGHAIGTNDATITAACNCLTNNRNANDAAPLIRAVARSNLALACTCSGTNGVADIDSNDGAVSCRCSLLNRLAHTGSPCSAATNDTNAA